MEESEEELKNLLMRVKEESETAGLMPCFHDCSHGIRRYLLLGRKGMTNRQCIKNQRHHFADKGLSSQRYGFSRSHVRVGPRLSTKELMLLNCGPGEDC